MGDYYLYAYKAGGWVMIPLTLCSLFGWMLVFQIVWRLREFEKKMVPDRTWRKFFSEIFSRKREKDGRIDGVAVRMNKYRQSPLAHAEAKLDELRKRWIPELEKGFPTLSVIITIAPLLGLFGTVGGIINTFKLMALFGTDNVTLLSMGIREALLITQAGLLVAVPLMVVHILLLGKTDKLESLIDQYGWDFIAGRKETR